MRTEYDSYDLFKETDDYLVKPKFHKEPSVHFYPSEASVQVHDEHGDLVTHGGCLRASYFRIMGSFDKVQFEPRSEYIFAQGKIIEQWLIDRWKEMGIWVDNNVKFFDKENNVSGELDAILAEPPSGQLYGLECKTCYGYMAEKEIFGDKRTKGFPKMNQLLQTLIYLNHFEDKLPYFRMAYFFRDSVKRRTFKIELHHEGNITYPKVEGTIIRQFSINDILNRYKLLQDYISRNAIPPGDYELQYPDAKIEDFARKGKVSKTKYEAWKSGKLKTYESIGDWNCFSPKTLVWLANGKMKEIQNLNIGDILIGMDGKTTVKRIEKKENSKPCVSIKPIGMLDTICTEDHKWLVANWTNASKFYNHKAFIPQLIEAKNIKITDSEEYSTVIIPIHSTARPSNLSIEQAKLLGYYTAEGHLANPQNGRYYQVVFTIHPDEEDMAQDIIRLAKDLFNANYKDQVIFDQRPEHNGWSYRKLQFYSVAMADFIRSHVLGKKAINKNLGPHIMGASKEAIKAFLDTASIGDGCWNEKQQYQILSTSSRILCNQYQQLYWKIGIPAIAQYANKPSNSFGYDTNQGYRVQYQGDSHCIQFITIGNDKFAITRVRSVNPVDLLPEVWDLEVDSHYHVFNTESGLASNCNYCSYKQICYGNQVVSSPSEE